MDEDIPEYEGEIRCICNIQDDDGFTIQCDSCSVWQHAVCVNISDNDVPDQYLCDRCNPRYLDASKALAAQMKRLKNEVGPNPKRRQSNNKPDSPRKRKDSDNGDRKMLGTPPKVNAALSTLDSPVNERASSRRFRTLSGLVDVVEPFVRTKKPVISVSQTKPASVYDIEYAASLQYAPLSVMRFQQDELRIFMNNYAAKTEKSVPIICPLDYISLVTYERTFAPTVPDQDAKVSHNDTEMLKVDIKAETTILEHMKVPSVLAFLAKNAYALPALSALNRLKNMRAGEASYGLFATVDIPAGTLVAEMKGVFSISEQTSSQQLPVYPAPSSATILPPFVFQCPALKDAFNIVLDTRKFGDSSRFVRTSCGNAAGTPRPNAKLVYIIFTSSSVSEDREIFGPNREPKATNTPSATARSPDAATGNNQIPMLRVGIVTTCDIPSDGEIILERTIPTSLHFSCVCNSRTMCRSFIAVQAVIDATDSVQAENAMDIDIADDIRLVQENRLNAVEKAKSELFAQQLDWSMAPIKRLEPIKEPVRLESGADLGQGVDDSNMMTSVSASSKMDVDISIGTTSSPVRPLQTPHTHVASPAAIDVQVAPLAIKSAVEAIKSKEEANTPVRKVSLRDWMMQKKERVASYDDHDSGDSSGQAVANDSGSVLLSKKVATSNSHTNTDQKLTSNMQNNGGRTVNPNLEKAIPPSLVISGAADKPQKSRESNHHTPLHRNYNETSTYNLQPPPPLRPASAAIETMHVFSRHGSPPLSRPTSAGPLSSRTHTPDPIRREPSREFEHLSTQRTDRDEYSHTHGSNYSDYRKQEPHRSSSARYDRDDAYRSSGDVRARNTYYDKASSRHDAHTHRDYQSRSGEPNTHTPVRYDAPTRDSEVHRSDRSGSDVRRAPRPYERTERRRTEYDDRDRDRHYESSDRRQERSDRVDRYARDESDEHYYSRRENTADSREGAQAGSGSSGNASGSRTVHDKEKSSEPRRDSREFPRDSQGRPRK